MNLKSLVGIFIIVSMVQLASGVIESCQDEKEFKNLLKTRKNLLILFSKSDSAVKDKIKLLKEVSEDVKNYASVSYINCETLKKVCKKLKVNPEPFELKHFSDGQFHKDYDRKLVKKSLVSFLRDPKGDLPWDEEEDSKDVVHIKDEGSFYKMLKKHSKTGILAMFYAPWCGYCKKLKPEYSAAASELKKQAVLAGIDVDLTENYGLRKTFNITGFPTLLYFRNGELQHPYGGETNKDSIINWMKDPQPPKEKEPEKSWADEDDVHVTFLTDETFDQFIETHKNVLVKFYAPWCGHCKNMKPIFNNVAKRLKEENSENIIAFVDATKETKLGHRFKVKGYPTIKFFQDGKFAWDYNERSEDKILEYMRNPTEPPKAQEEPEWKDEKSHVVHADSESFAPFLKTKKHALVMFYAPWCGHCKTAKPEITKAAEYYKDDLKVAFVGVDCTKHQSVCDQFGVKGFPTIIYFNYGKNQRPYEGGRQSKDFIKFMKNPQDPNAGKSDPRDEWLDITGNENVQFLDDSNFDEFIASKKQVLVMFYAPWCGHCKNMKPAYALAATEVSKQIPNAVIAAVDATKTSQLNKKFEIKGFPSIKYFEDGKFKLDYEGGRSKDDLVNFMKNPNPVKPDPRDDWKDLPGNKHVYLLDDSNFDEFVNNKRRVLVMFYAPWCGHCKNMKPAYSLAANDVTSFVPGSYLAAVDVTQNPQLGKRFDVKGFPTLKFFESGHFKFDYNGVRAKEDFINFMRNPVQAKTEL